MSRVEALKELLAKVEAGTVEEGDFERAFKEELNFFNAMHACLGSLDAAKSLHDAVLPGWEWGVTTNEEMGAGFVAFVATWGGEEGFEATAANPARAWLVSILKALIAAEQEGE